MHKGINTTLDEGQTPVIAFSSKDHGADAGSGVSPTLRAMGHTDSHANGGGQIAVIVPRSDVHAFPGRLSGTQVAAMANVSPALVSLNPTAVAFAMQAGVTRENPLSGPDGVGVQADHAYTLEARAEVQAVAFDLRGREGGAMPEGPHLTANIRAASGGSSRSYIAQSFKPSHYTRGKDGGLDDVFPPLSADADRGDQDPLVLAQFASRWAVRRLTPLECERLQGFPDGYTLVPGAATAGWRALDETESLEDLHELGMPLRNVNGIWRVMDPDGPRYKALGNSMAVNVMRWVGWRIETALA